MTPSTITLADGRPIAFHLHPILTSEDNGRAEPSARRYVLQPTVPELARMAAVDF